MNRFLAGFATASLLWGGVIALFMTGALQPSWSQPGPAEASGDAGPGVGDASVASERGDRRARRRRGARTGGERVPQGRATTGDDLGEADPRNLDMGEGGGEEQLPSSAVEEGFDGVFGRIRKCLVLAAGDEPVTGKLRFGLRIAGTGEVTRVNLSGPAAATTGDAGECLRKTAKSIQFASFDGPDMVVHYPITLE